MKTQKACQSINKSPIRLGISACLMGDMVRYNAGHSQSKLCTKGLTQYFEFEKFCPEVTAGFGTPRPTMRLVGNPESPTLTYSDDSSENLTHQLINSVQEPINNMSNLDGYILMKNSPSCGLFRIKVYQDNGYPHEQKVSGLFTQQLMNKYPLLPIEEEGRLNDASLRENFILRVYAYHNFRHQVLEDPSYHKLIQYHSSYKLVLLAHNQKTFKELGKMLGQSRNIKLEKVIHDYFERFMAAIHKPASRGGHCNAMQHILGYLKTKIPDDARQDIAQIIEQYRQREINLITPLTLLSHYIQQFGTPYIRAQRYIEPYPSSLGLRNLI